MGYLIVFILLCMWLGFWEVVLGALGIGAVLWMLSSWICEEQK